MLDENTRSDRPSSNDGSCEPENRQDVAMPATRYAPVVFAVFALFLVFVLYQIVGGLLSLWVMGGLKGLTNAAMMRASTLVSQLLFILVPTILLARFQHRKVARAIPFRIPKLSEFLLAIAAVFSLLQTMKGYLYFQDLIPIPEIAKPLVDQLRRLIEETFLVLVHSHSTSEILYVILVVAVVPAICEEMLFRGLVQTNLSLGSTPVRGFVVAGIVFGLYHFNPFLLVPLTILGIFFGFLQNRSQSILIPIVAHFSNNLVSLLGAFAADDLPRMKSLEALNESGLTAASALEQIAGFGAVFVILTYFYIIVTRQKTNVSFSAGEC